MAINVQSTVEDVQPPGDLMFKRTVQDSAAGLPVPQHQCFPRVGDWALRPSRIQDGTILTLTLELENRILGAGQAVSLGSVNSCSNPEGGPGRTHSQRKLPSSQKSPL